ncbi:MAG: 2-amino-4-hydroxy-6-hydroxymethyldihydropteridine diphosphokinase [Desulfovibrionales bacterium]|nr:2-amino-4-hydroxy-6-hydroxymethyldihydropteridine diphosphokinase [Desulfovibrionales bacterium]
MGDVDANLARAINMIDELEGVSVASVSPVYKTEPQNKKDQEWFANQVVSVNCDHTMTAIDLLDTLLSIEDVLGRVRKERFGPRIIDLDVLMFGEQVISSDRLTVPHPRMHERAFVLVPLHDIAPEVCFPDGRGLSEVLSCLNYKVDACQIWQ